MNKYIYIGNDLIAGPLTDDDLMYNNLHNVPKIEVNGTHSWEINQILEEDVDFRLQAESEMTLFGHQLNDIVAVPISKPNTDLKQNTQYSEQNYSKEDAIGFAEWANDENYSYLGEGTWEGDCEHLISSQDLFNEYLSSPAFKNNQL